MKYIKADIVDCIKSGEYDAAAHSCNCFTTMGSGVAKALRAAFPQIYSADCLTEKGDYDKLGNYTLARHENCEIYNLYTQYNYGKDGKQYVIYPALELCLMKMCDGLPVGSRIVLPRLSCALAGGNWDLVSKMIEDTLEIKHFVTICDL
jgi:O-acetyl-ADP-ribose deacetylase (regulator of RNase III)